MFGICLCISLFFPSIAIILLGAEGAQPFAFVVSYRFLPCYLFLLFPSLSMFGCDV